MRFLLFAGVSCLFQRALASLANVTIDDTFGDPQTGARIVYSPVSAWENGAQACSTSCAARPDPRQLCNGTWHETIFISHSGDSKDDSSQIPSASVTFSGSAIYVYCVIAHSSNSSKTSDMTFSIDNEVVGTFSLASSTGNKSEYQYNVPVYVNHSMPAGVHKFTLQNRLNEREKSLIMLDSIVYTHSYATSTFNFLSTPSSSQSTAKPRSKVMMGSILGILLGLLFIAPGLYLCVRHHRRRQRLAPSQQYAASKAAGNLFEARRVPPPPQNIDLLPELEDVCVIPKAHYPEALCNFSTNGARSVTREAASSASQSTSQREPPLKPGRTFRVMNR